MKKKSWKAKKRMAPRMYMYAYVWTTCRRMCTCMCMCMCMCVCTYARMHARISYYYVCDRMCMFCDVHMYIIHRCTNNTMVSPKRIQIQTIPFWSSYHRSWRTSHMAGQLHPLQDQQTLCVAVWVSCCLLLGTFSGNSLNRPLNKSKAWQRGEIPNPEMGNPVNLVPKWCLIFLP